MLESSRTPFRLTAKDLRNADNEPIEATNHPMMKFSFSCEEPLESGAILRKEREEAQRVII